MHQYIDLLAAKLPVEIAQYWWRLGADGPVYFLYAEIGIALILWVWIMYRGTRWALGHKKALGVWWRRQEYQNLMQELYDRHREGKVLAHAEIKLVRKYTEGTTKTISRQSVYY